MGSMEIDRRQFLAGAGALALGGMVPLKGGRGAALAGCFRDRSGADFFATLAADGRSCFSVGLPARGHGMADRPGVTGAGEVVAFARRPGTFALAIDADGAVAHHLKPVSGRHFQGHGVFSADGRYLFASENHFQRGRGVIGIYDAADSYRRIGEHASHGIGPHDMALLPDSRTLAVANGGILTHPDEGRAKLNLPTMKPSLAFIDIASGRLAREFRLAPELHQLSIRHLSVAADGAVAVALQYQGPKTRLLALVGLADPARFGDRIRLLDAPPEVTARMRHYCGSVAFDESGRYFAVSSPRGGLATLWDRREPGFAKVIDLADVCGVAPAGTGRFVFSSGADGMVRAGATAGSGSGDGDLTPLSSPWLRRVHWDNHLIALA